MFKENQTCSIMIEHIGFMEPAWPDFIWLSESQAKIGVPEIESSKNSQYIVGAKDRLRPV